MGFGLPMNSRTPRTEISYLKQRSSIARPKRLVWVVCLEMLSWASSPRHDDSWGVPCNQHTLVAIGIFQLPGQETRTNPKVLQFRVPHLRLCTLDIDGAVHQFEVFDDRMRAGQRFDE